MITAVIIWLVCGFIAIILVFIDIKQQSKYITIRDVALAPVGILFGIVFLLIVLANVDMFKGFWDRKIF